MYKKKNKKDVVIFVNAIRPDTFEAFAKYKKLSKIDLKAVVLVNKNIKDSILSRNNQLSLSGDYTTIDVDFDSPASLLKAIKPYFDRVFSVTAQFENCIYELEKLSPILPDFMLSSESSLTWSTDKKYMRKLFEALDPNLVPGYLEMRDSSPKTLTEIKSTLKFPLVIKPSGLEGSLLVSYVADINELKQVYENMASQMQKGYDTWIKRQKPAVLVEEFMDGDMYTIDTYVSAKGEYIHTPIVHVVTGRKVGYDDFFGYARISPVDMDKTEIQKAQLAAEAACKALRLRSTTAHIELMRTKDTWKIIEVGPRIGGYRHKLYELTYGINHIMNDILVRAGMQVVVPIKPLGFTSIMNIYAKTEGKMKSVAGLDEVKSLSSIHSVVECMHVGDDLFFAKNNGDPVFEIVLFSSSKSQLFEDMAQIEKMLTIEVED